MGSLRPSGEQGTTCLLGVSLMLVLAEQAEALWAETEFTALRGIVPQVTTQSEGAGWGLPRG
jgi:hypothetical protein